MELQVIETVETEIVDGQELMELSSEMLGQVGGGGVVLNE
jgi:hypothetical protein